MLTVCMLIFKRRLGMYTLRVSNKNTKWEITIRLVWQVGDGTDTTG